MVTEGYSELQQVHKGLQLVTAGYKGLRGVARGFKG